MPRAALALSLPSTAGGMRFGTAVPTVSPLQEDYRPGAHDRRGCGGRTRGRGLWVAAAKKRGHERQDADEGVDDKETRQVLRGQNQPETSMPHACRQTSRQPLLEPSVPQGKTRLKASAPARQTAKASASRARARHLHAESGALVLRRLGRRAREARVVLAGLVLAPQPSHRAVEHHVAQVQVEHVRNQPRAPRPAPANIHLDCPYPSQVSMTASIKKASR